MSEQPQANQRERKYRRSEASEYLKQEHDLDCAPTTLAKLATTGGGPPFFSGPKFPLYPQRGLDEWAKRKLGKLVNSTSEAPPKPAPRRREPVAA
jgi:hypothetical protein